MAMSRKEKPKKTIVRTEVDGAKAETQTIVKAQPLKRRNG